MHIRHAPKIIAREEENCYLLINRRRNEKLVLNDSSFFVWKLCEDSTLDDIIKKVVETFTVDENTARDQIITLIEKLHQRGFIEVEKEKEEEVEQ